MEEFNRSDFDAMVNGICDVIYGLYDISMTKPANSNVYARKLNLDVSKELSKYYTYLESLYEVAISNGILDDIDDYPELFRDIHEEYNSEVESRIHRDLMDELSAGDLVRLRDGRTLYVADPYYTNSSAWVTADKSNRADSYNAKGWVADHNDIVEIIEKFN